MPITPDHFRIFAVLAALPILIIALPGFIGYTLQVSITKTRIFCRFLKDFLTDKMQKLPIIRIDSIPFGQLMYGTLAKCGQCHSYLDTVATPEFCITQCLEFFPSKECIPECFQDCKPMH